MTPVGPPPTACGDTHVAGGAVDNIARPSHNWVSGLGTVGLMPWWGPWRQQRANLLLGLGGCRGLDTDDVLGQRASKTLEGWADESPGPTRAPRSKAEVFHVKIPRAGCGKELEILCLPIM